MKSKFDTLYENLVGGGMMGVDTFNMGVQRNFPDPANDTGFTSQDQVGLPATHKDVNPDEREGNDEFIKFEELGNGSAVAIEKEGERFEVVLFDIDENGQRKENAEYYFDELSAAEELYNKLVSEYRGTN